MRVKPVICETKGVLLLLEMDGDDRRCFMVQERRKRQEAEQEVAEMLRFSRQKGSGIRTYVFVEAKVRWFGHGEACWGWSCRAGNHLLDEEKLIRGSQDLRLGQRFSYEGTIGSPDDHQTQLKLQDFLPKVLQLSSKKV